MQKDEGESSDEWLGEKRIDDIGHSFMHRIRYPARLVLAHNHFNLSRLRERWLRGGRRVTRTTIRLYGSFVRSFIRERQREMERELLFRERFRRAPVMFRILR